MKTNWILVAMAAAFILSLAFPRANAEQLHAFDETLIRTMQDSRTPSQAFMNAEQAFEASNNTAIKAARWEDLVVAAAEGLLAKEWTAPSAGWKLLSFPTSGNLLLQDIRDQPSQAASNTKLVAINETEAVQLRGAGALILSAALDGEQWGSKLILDIAQRPDGNLKRLTYWFANNFGQDAVDTTWPVDWNAWQQVYDTADALGKAIILKNVTMLAIRHADYTTAAAINLSALSGTDRELKAIAIAFGDPALGTTVTAKWLELANNSSDQQIKALAQEACDKFGVVN